jgi:putative endonuclease
MYYTYILKSSINNFIYVGSTEDIENRLIRHNSGKVKSTKAYKPWKLMESRNFSTRSDAMKEELFLKTGQQKELLRKKYVSML